MTHLVIHFTSVPAKDSGIIIIITFLSYSIHAVFILINIRDFAEELIQGTSEHEFSIAHSMNDKWTLKNVEVNYSRHTQTVSLK